MQKKSDLSDRNPTGRFTGLTDLYSKHRPGYPSAAIDAIITRCGLSNDSLLIDVGSGTGISSRLFAERNIRVIGIEPNAEMRAAAAAGYPVRSECPAPTYQDGRAEATGLPGGIADAVLAAQAFHWFQADSASAEFHRILKPGGWVILLWNERDEREEVTAAYGAIIRSAPDAAAVEGPRGKAGEALLRSPIFVSAERLVYPYEQELDLEGLLGRAFSASYAPRDDENVARWKKELQSLFAKFERRGKVVIRYETTVYLAQECVG